MKKNIAQQNDNHEDGTLQKFGAWRLTMRGNRLWPPRANKYDRWIILWSLSINQYKKINILLLFWFLQEYGHKLAAKYSTASFSSNSNTCLFSDTPIQNYVRKAPIFYTSGLFRRTLYNRLQLLKFQKEVLCTLSKFRIFSRERSQGLEEEDSE